MKYDSAFVSRLRKRDEQAFRELYEYAGTRLYNYILYRAGRNADTAEDILAEVFCDAVDYAGTLTPLHNVEAWLWRIAKSKIADHFRRLGKNSKWRSDTEVDTLSNGKGPGCDPEAQIMEQEDKLVVQAAFARLSDEYRDVLSRMYIEEQSMRDIAGAIGRTEKAVESILYRARKQLEKELSRLGIKKPGKAAGAG